MAALEGESGGHQKSFMAGPRDLEENLLLTFEKDLAVIQPARHKHQPVHADELFASESLVSLHLRAFPFRNRGLLVLGLMLRPSERDSDSLTVLSLPKASPFILSRIGKRIV